MIGNKRKIKGEV